mmetsp:Transcript_29383/g.94320  ORF Transcript_29383/g.94320 Transcript_29383/m.94320 type:complete len:232 (-) Transcript_29383:2268-2963(-)
MSCCRRSRVRCRKRCVYLFPMRAAAGPTSLATSRRARPEAAGFGDCFAPLPPLATLAAAAPMARPGSTSNSVYASAVSRTSLGSSRSFTKRFARTTASPGLRPLLLTPPASPPSAIATSASRCASARVSARSPSFLTTLAPSSSSSVAPARLARVRMPGGRSGALASTPSVPLTASRNTASVSRTPSFTSTSSTYEPSSPKTLPINVVASLACFSALTLSSMIAVRSLKLL